jgi:hypothetical protein
MMTLDEAIAALEEQRASLGGQARVVLPHLVGVPLREVLSVEAVLAAKIRPHGYVGTEGMGGRDNQKVVVIRS